MKLLPIIICLFSYNSYSLSLEDALKRLHDNEQVKIAKKETEISNIEVDVLKSAVLPDLSLNGSYNKYGPGKTLNESDQTSMSVGLVQPLYRGLKEWKAFESAKVYSKSQKYLENAKIRELQQELIVKFFNYLIKSKELELNKELVRLSDERLKDISYRVKIGKSKRSDYLSAESLLFNTKANVERLQKEVDDARILITTLIPLEKEEVLTAPEFKNNISFNESDIENYPTVKALELLREIAKKKIEISKADHQPSVDLKSNYYLHNSNDSTQRDWDAAVVMSFPLYSGGKTSAQVSADELRYRRTIYEIDRGKKVVSETLSTLYNEFETGERRIDLLDKANKANKVNYEEYKKEFKLGLVTSLEVLSALTQYIEAKKNFFTTKLAVQSAGYQIKSLAGKNL